MSSLPLGYSLRLAIVKNVTTTHVECYYMDTTIDRNIVCPIPHPYSGRGSGIFVGVEKNAIVLVALARGEDPFIIGFVPDRSLYFNQEGIDDSPIELSEYPEVNSGEISIRSVAGAQIDVKNDGNVTLDANIGVGTYDLELSSAHNVFYNRADNEYKFSQAGRSIEGIIRRDFNQEETSQTTNSINFLFDESYDDLLNDVGRSTKDEVQLRTTKISKSVTRNPALVEQRQITYEYAYDYGVRGLEYEALATVQTDKKTVEDGINNIVIDSEAREQRRTDVMDLNLRNYNHLIEKIQGTVVDIYGNMLDINRNVINTPEVEGLDTRNSDTAIESLKRINSFVRRSIKYHMEINSRKDIDATEPSLVAPGHNAKNHSRWSIDVDGEGLTKINIPASSETGNIPVLSRYVVSRNTNSGKEDEGQHKDQGIQRKDVRILQFGAKNANNPSAFSGQVLSNSDYAPEPQKIEGKTAPTVTTGTAHHDINNIANSIFQEKSSKNNIKVGGKLRDPGASGGKLVLPLVSSINNTIPPIKGGTYQTAYNDLANAGGRSLHANLDGSVEFSIGADTADRKSMVLDLAGSCVSHFGRDKNGRSIIHQTDGDVIIQIGGKAVEDKRFNDTANRPGRIEIHLNRPGGSSQKVIIDEKGMTIDLAGNAVIKTTGDLSLSAGGSLLLNGENIFAYGSVNDDVDGNRAITGSERMISRKGRHI